MAAHRDRGVVSSQVMPAPGPTTPLDLQTHDLAEQSFRKLKGAQPGVDAIPFQLLEQFKAQRQQFWASKKKTDRFCGNRHVQPRYTVSRDGCWVIESVGYAADMCHLTERFIFNLCTFQQLREADMHPWVTLDPPKQQQPFSPWGPDGPLPDSPTSDPDPSQTAQQFVAESSPNLCFNIGCHDDYSDEEDYPDYHSGCAAVSFRECELSHLSAHALSSKVQVIRASRYADTWDKTGRHWMYVLPSSPLESVLKKTLTSRLPLGLVQRVWEFGVSWPTASSAPAVEPPQHSGRLIAMKVDPRWPFNMLRVRRCPESANFSAETTPDVVAIIPGSAFADLTIMIDAEHSTTQFWKLAACMKATLQNLGFILKDFEEGFITKTYHGLLAENGSDQQHNSLVVVHH